MMTDANQLTARYAFTTEGLDLLEARLEDSEHPQTFIEAVDELATDSRYLLELASDIELIEPLDPEDDGHNASVLYESVGAVDRANASDPRLWTYLATVTLRDYMLVRWPLEKANNFKNLANERWLMTTASPRKLMRNGAARLWWTADLTHDPDLKHPYSSETGDPFAYTKWVLENENRRQNLFERQLGRSPKLRWAVMEAMQEIQEKGKKDNSKTLLKKVHLHTGYQRLESLPEEELKKVVSDLLHEVI